MSNHKLYIMIGHGLRRMESRINKFTPHRICRPAMAGTLLSTRSMPSLRQIAFVLHLQATSVTRTTTLCRTVASCAHLGLDRARYVLYGVKHIDLVSRAPLSGLTPADLAQCTDGWETNMAALQKYTLGTAPSSPDIYHFLPHFRLY